MGEMKERIRDRRFLDRIRTAEEAAGMIKNGMTIASSGFTPSGYPKAVPLALAERKKGGDDISVTWITGASTGDELDGELSRCGVIKRRYPYQTHDDMRKLINSGDIRYADVHLSHLSNFMSYGFLGKIDMAIVEAAAVTEEGGIVPSTSVGISPQALKLADKVIIEVNTSQPLSLEGVHDIYMLENPPLRKPIPIIHPWDRIGKPYMEVDFEKVVAVVWSDITDKVRSLGTVDDNSRRISEHIIGFFKDEIAAGRLPGNLLPLQSGVGSVANAVLWGLLESDFRNLACCTEVIQDSMLDLIDAGKVDVASGTSFTPSEEGLSRLLDNMDHYAQYCILRPMDISNNPEVIRRLGVIAMNTAIEVDIYGHVNSTSVMGSRMVNGIGGSGDFTRNSFFSIFTTVSTAKNGQISSIVPMVSHVDHTEHDVEIVVTEQGLADLRGLCPVERAEVLIEKCAHPDFRPMLWDYLQRSLKNCSYKYQPHLMDEALSWHTRFLDTGSMKNE